MDAYVDLFQARGGSMVMLAKGNRSAVVRDACRKHGGFYLGSIGGPAARLAEHSIKKVDVLEYPELGMEAIWKIEVEDFPAFIVVDAQGNDFYAGLVDKGGGKEAGQGLAGGRRLSTTVPAPVAAVVVTRRRAAALAAIALVAAPFFLPADAYLARALCTGFAISVAMKTRLLWVGRDADPGMLATWPRFIVWLLVPPATTWPRTPAEATREPAAGVAAGAAGGGGVRAAAGAGRGQALAGHTRGRGAVGAAGAGGGGDAGVLRAAAGDDRRADGGWCGWAASRSSRCSCTRRGRAGRGSSGRCAGTGWSTASPATRCSRPVARRGGRVLAVLATFAASGLMHEYLVVACVGLAAYRPGLMLAFFLLQALAVLFERATGSGRQGSRRWPPVVNFAWLALTTPLFFRPLDPQIAAFDRACLAIARTLLAPVLP